ncbi:Uridine-cytidine kinase-like 1 [Blyttiomyces sp. JEL0837]|nr:Uridine-cytidine kinase-like 1 [Blyttiomyces sp. JEL0837]
MSGAGAAAKVQPLSQGRFPWYTVDGKPREPYIIGIGGGSASGKTSVSHRIIRQLGVPWVVLLQMDSFYKSLTKEQIEQAYQNNYDFDHPNAFDFDVLYETLLNLKKGIKVDVPVYDFATHSRLNKTTPVYGANVIIFEGIFALYDSKVRDLMDLKLFVDTDADVRLARRLKRDIAERGRDLHGVLAQYRKFVKPAFDEHISRTMKYADVIIPRGLDNVAAIDVIIKQVVRELNSRGLTLRTQLASLSASKDVPSSVRVLTSKPELKALHTLIRDKTTPRDDFIFYAARLSRLVVERGLVDLPYSDISIVTPTQSVYDGKKLAEGVCGVSVIRSGATMEHGLRQVVKDIPLGKILIQTDASTGEPQLHYCKLPKDINKRHVLIADATIATGAAALMAIRVILDHDVPEEHIIFLSLIAAPQGLHAVANAFPNVRIITSEIDPELSEDFHIVPGFGNFGDRYFGTY